jgi:hypothetical protein
VLTTKLLSKDGRKQILRFAQDDKSLGSHSAAVFLIFFFEFGS